jgi:predicted DNA-binding protein
VASDKDIEYEELGPGKGARITLTGETCDEVNAAAERLGVAGSEFLRAAIEAFVKEPRLQAEVMEHLREEEERGK